MPRNRILYVVQGIPGNNAPTKHAFAIADLMAMCGYDSHFMLAGIIDPANPALKESFDYPVEFPASLTLGCRQLVAKYAERLTCCASTPAFKEALGRLKPALVVYYGIQNGLAKAIVRESHAVGIPVVVDETDWFEVRFEGDLAAWIVSKSRERRVADADEKADGILAISPFFRDYFAAIQKAKGSPRVMFLPPLNREGDALDELGPAPAAKRATTRFFYAGSPAGKDYLDCFVEAMDTCAASVDTAPELDVVGVSPDEGAALLRGRGAGATVRFHGCLPHGEVIAMLRRADFGILFRRPALYARAGFSTKFAECMSNGVPMLCNAVGGADLVLEPGVDGLVVADLSAASLAEGVRAACNMGESELRTMKQAALEKSKGLFQPERYVGVLADFINAIGENRK